MTQTISKKIHPFVKDILHTTVNGAQSHGIQKKKKTESPVKASFSPAVFLFLFFLSPFYLFVLLVCTTDPFRPCNDIL